MTRQAPIPGEQRGPRVTGADQASAVQLIQPHAAGEPFKEGHRTAVGSLSEPPGDVSTPTQQAALQELMERRPVVDRYLRAVAETGTRAAACRIVDIDPSTIHRWCEVDPTLREQEAQARRSVGERVVSRMAGAALGATDEQLLNHPTGPIAVVNWLLPELRPNASQVQVAVQVNLADKLTSQRLEEIAAACEAGD